MVTVYSKTNCPYCDRAKALLESKGINYVEVSVEKDTEARQMLLDQGLRSVPQIFHGFELIPGGFQGLSQRPESFFRQLKGV
jgi:glutaredoxin